MTPAGVACVEAGGETLWLLPGCAAYWPRRATLLVADAHLGKAAAFRRAGIPVPRGTTESNLSRLSALARTYPAQRIVFLGDLIHDASAKRAASAAFVRWRAHHQELAVVLVLGNHDRRAGEVAAEWRISVFPEPLVENGFALCHMPQHVPGSYVIAGHTHPAVRLSGPGRDSARLPCFWFSEVHAVMPAFGAFTGLADIVPGAGDKVFVAAGERVVRVQ